LKGTRPPEPRLWLKRRLQPWLPAAAAAAAATSASALLHQPLKSLPELLSSPASTQSWWVRQYAEVSPNAIPHA
jgi:hypothetical protein